MSTTIATTELAEIKAEMVTREYRTNMAYRAEVNRRYAAATRKVEAEAAAAIDTDAILIEALRANGDEAILALDAIVEALEGANAVLEETLEATTGPAPTLYTIIDHSLGNEGFELEVSATDVEAAVREAYAKANGPFAFPEVRLIHDRGLADFWYVMAKLGPDADHKAGEIWAGTYRVAERPAI